MERIDGSVEEDLQHWCEIGVELSQELVLLFPLFRMIQFISIRQSSRKGGDLIVGKDLTLGRLRKLDRN